MPPIGKLNYGAVALGMSLMASNALAADESDFLIDTTGNLAALCSASPEEPNYSAAIHMCQGYIIGIAHFHQALSAELKEDIYCVPEGDARPSRNEAVAMFVDWAGNNPDSAGTEALDGVLAWAAAAFPCK